MTIFNGPIKIELNSHGGVILFFGGFHLWNTIGGQWCINTESENHNLDEVFNDIVSAYEFAIKWKKLKSQSATPAK